MVNRIKSAQMCQLVCRLMPFDVKAAKRRLVELRLLRREFEDDEWDRSTPLNALPGLQHQPPRAEFADADDFFFFKDAEGFAGEVGAVDVGWIEDVAEVALSRP
ncbi:MAG: hypothetical protein Kow001_13110 [Acidobacteriota bacterium]